MARGFVFGDGTTLTAGGPATAIFYGEKDAALLPFFDAEAGAIRTYFYRYDPALPNRKEHVPLSGCGPERVASGEVRRYRKLAGLPREWKTDYPSLESDPNELYE